MPPNSALTNKWCHEFKNVEKHWSSVLAIQAHDLPLEFILKRINQENKNNCEKILFHWFCQKKIYSHTHRWLVNKGKNYGLDILANGLVLSPPPLVSFHKWHHIRREEGFNHFVTTWLKPLKSLTFEMESKNIKICLTSLWTTSILATLYYFSKVHLSSHKSIFSHTQRGKNGKNENPCKNHTFDQVWGRAKPVFP